LFHQSQAIPDTSRDLVLPARSQADHWLFSLPPSTWCDAVETPQRKPSGNFVEFPPCGFSVASMIPWNDMLVGAF
jgi:hypothetical protein